MNVLSRYSFIANYQVEKMTRQDANSAGIGSVDFDKCDTDGDGNITIEEILANDDVCQKIIQAINKKQADAASALQTQQALVEPQQEESAQSQLALQA